MSSVTAALLSSWVEDARRRTLELVADLDDRQLLGPRLRIVNPLRWEIGHVAWFQEKWVLRDTLGEPPLREDGDALYDSSAVPHDTRWDLPLPDRRATLDYLAEVRDRVLDRLATRPLDEPLRYFVMLSVFHEDMHDEAFSYTRQTHGWPRPQISAAAAAPDGPRDVLAGDVDVPGGIFRLGAEPPGEPFVFDNEKWAHPVEVRPFRIARSAVTQAELAGFVLDGGYERRELWSDDGWRWRTDAGALHPVHWRREGASFLRRDFDRLVPLEPDRPVLHVNAHEAEAYCRWARRRLPTELEWEVAAAGEPDGHGGLAPRKRTHPWGEEPPGPGRAHVDSIAGAAPAGALPGGESAFGCRQMTGNVWEWTSTAFGPYPGFVADPYKEYSEPWFGDHRVLRGGCFVTRGRLLRNSWRNFYTPDRRDVWAGFRTCAID
jgi:iron(II)-dependent oxidoreductase